MRNIFLVSLIALSLFSIAKVYADLPLPKVVYDTQSGGGIITSMKSATELQNQYLQNQMMEQQLAFMQQQRLERIQEEKQLTEDNTTKVMIFSQNKYTTYLGCLNCPSYIEDSIHNEVNPFGSKYGKKSIYNTHGIYGSKNSDLSACNSHAIHPPVVINNRGAIFGLLTLNTKLRGAIKEPIVLKWLKTRVCKK